MGYFVQNQSTETQRKKQNHQNQTNNKKTPELQGKQLLFHGLKAKQATRQKQKHKTKTKNTKNKANIETERLKHTP